MMYYTGIGSRQTPPDVLDHMADIGRILGLMGYCLRSGNAGGADSAFYEGHVNVSDDYEIFLPWRNFGNHKNGKFIALDDIDQFVVKQAESIVISHHPAWDRCSDPAKKLHTRNVFQILGTDLETPSKIVICWTEKGKMVGGTATALSIAQSKDIPIVNLGELSVGRTCMEDIFDDY